MAHTIAPEAIADVIAFLSPEIGWLHRSEARSR
jgi:hypothetical protein